MHAAKYCCIPYCMFCFRYSFFYFVCVQLAQSALDCGSHMLGQSFGSTYHGRAISQQAPPAERLLLPFFIFSRIFKCWIQLCQYLCMSGKTALEPSLLRYRYLFSIIFLILWLLATGILLCSKCWSICVIVFTDTITFLYV